MRKLFYLLGLVIALVSCNGKNDVAGEVEVIDIQEGVENRGHVMLSKYASEIKYTILIYHLQVYYLQLILRFSVLLFCDSHSP